MKERKKVMNKNYEIEKRLWEHLNKVLSKYNYDWFAIALQGSQNYGLDTEESDIDSKLLIIPSLQDLALNERPVSYTYIMDNDEHCDVKDVREYFKLFKKQNINFLEILVTDYYIVNTKYEQEWEMLRSAAEKIGRYDIERTVRACIGMMQEKYDHLAHPFPSRIEHINRYGYDPKQLIHILRIQSFLNKYIDKQLSYKQCIDESNNEALQFYKRNPEYLFKAQAEKIAELMIQLSNDHYLVDEKINSLQQRTEDTYGTKYKSQTNSILKLILMVLIEKSVQERLSYE